MLYIKRVGRGAFVTNTITNQSIVINIIGGMVVIDATPYDIDKNGVELANFLSEFTSTLDDLNKILKLIEDMHNVSRT